MASERSKRRDFLSLSFITKLILINLTNNYKFLSCLSSVRSVLEVVGIRREDWGGVGNWGCYLSFSHLSSPFHLEMPDIQAILPAKKKFAFFQNKKKEFSFHCDSC